MSDNKLFNKPLCRRVVGSPTVNNGAGTTDRSTWNSRATNYKLKTTHDNLTREITRAVYVLLIFYDEPLSQDTSNTCCCSKQYMITLSLFS